MSEIQDVLAVSPFKSFFGRVSYIAVGPVLRFSLQFIVIILFSRKLSLTDYGIYQFIWMFTGFFSITGLFGITALILSHPVADILIFIRKKRMYIIGIFLLLNISAVVYLFYFNSYFSPSEKILLFVLLVMQNISLVAESLAVKNEKERKLFLSNLLYLVVYVSVHLYCFLYTYSVSVIMGGLILAGFVKCCLLLFKPGIDLKSKTAVSNVGMNWFWLGLNDLLGILVKWLDKWIIIVFLPASLFAIYFNGTYEIPVFLLLLSAVGSISLVELSKLKKNDPVTVKQLFEKSAVFMAAFIFPSFWFLLMNSHDFFFFLFGAKYLASAPVFMISVLILPVRIIYSTTVLQVFNRTDLIVKGSLLDFGTAVALVLILYPFFGIRGIAGAFVVSTYIQVLYYLWHTGRILKKPLWFFLPLQKLFLFLLISFITAGAFRLGSAYFSFPTGFLLQAAGCMVSVSLFLLYVFKKKRMMELPLGGRDFEGQKI